MREVKHASHIPPWAGLTRPPRLLNDWIGWSSQPMEEKGYRISMVIGQRR
jgi:hypothetical protein